jgi:transposase
MQGRKTYQPKLYTTFNLVDRIPENNFYRRLKDVLNLHFLYNETKEYYGSCGQKSLDPTVFFRLCLVGYLENIISDRQLVQHASMRLDILYFIDYDIDDELPWHSTISRTRDLFPDAVFERIFEKVLSMCVDKGMVLGKTQAIDSAPVISTGEGECKYGESGAESTRRRIGRAPAQSTSDEQGRP